MIREAIYYILNVILCQLVLLMDSVLIPCDVKMLIPCAPVEFVNAIVASKILTETVWKVTTFQTFDMKNPGMNENSLIWPLF